MRAIGNRLGCRITLFDWGIYFTKWNEHCLSSFAFTDKICAVSDSRKKVSTAHEMRWQIPASASIENAGGIRLSLKLNPLLLGISLRIVNSTNSKSLSGPRIRPQNFVFIKEEAHNDGIDKDELKTLTCFVRE